MPPAMALNVYENGVPSLLKCGGKELVLEVRLPSQREVMRALLPGSFRE